jgi:hypothetical protein
MALVGASDRLRRGRLSQERDRERGQGVVEFSIVVPVLLVLLLGMLEFGLLFDHTISLSYASREGARVGAALGNGGGPLGCGTGQSPNAATVDPQIIAAVQRVLTSPGSPIDESHIQLIQIYRSSSGGTPITGDVNTWAYDPGNGPVVDGKALDFRVQTVQWAACSRDNGASPDSIGIGLVYRYQFSTPLAGALTFFGGPGTGTVTVSDRAVMALNPRN